MTDKPRVTVTIAPCGGQKSDCQNSLRIVASVRSKSLVQAEEFVS
jgi:hypothetical protein